MCDVWVYSQSDNCVDSLVMVRQLKENGYNKTCAYITSNFFLLFAVNGKL